MTAFEIVELQPQPAAVVRSTVALEALPEFFGGAFTRAMAAIEAAGAAVVGPPFGFYPTAPGELVEVAAGFPTSRMIEPSGDVVPLELPGGRAVTGMHIGPYDTLEQTYAALMAWVAGQGIVLAAAMWESYLSDPAAELDPAAWRTQVWWPIA